MTKVIKKAFSNYPKAFSMNTLSFFGLYMEFNDSTANFVLLKPQGSSFFH